eukprot:403354840
MSSTEEDLKIEGIYVDDICDDVNDETHNINKCSSHHPHWAELLCITYLKYGQCLIENCTVPFHESIQDVQQNLLYGKSSQQTAKSNSKSVSKKNNQQKSNDVILDDDFLSSMNYSQPSISKSEMIQQKQMSDSKDLQQNEDQVYNQQIYDEDVDEEKDFNYIDIYQIKNNNDLIKDEKVNYLLQNDSNQEEEKQSSFDQIYSKRQLQEEEKATNFSHQFGQNKFNSHFNDQEQLVSINYHKLEQKKLQEEKISNNISFKELFEKNQAQNMVTPQEEKKYNSDEYFVCKAIRYKPRWKDIKIKRFKENGFNHQLDWKTYNYDDSNEAQEVEIYINKRYFDQGQMCYAFKGIDKGKMYDTVSRKMIFKIPIDDIETQEEQENFVKMRKKINYLAYILVKYFRSKCLEKDIQLPLFYLLPYRYELKTPFMGYTHIYAEDDLNIDEINLKWEKFSDNGGRCQINFYSTFSHYTYHLTNEVFMITDIQGQSQVLSDPAIHSNPISLLDDPFNNGDKGFEMFFQSQHTNCTDLCQKLRIPLDVKQNVEQHKYVQLQIAQIKPDEDVLIYCDRCNMLKLMKYSQMKANVYIEYGHHLFCTECEQEFKLMVEKKCMNCKQNFLFCKEHWLEMYGKEPIRCRNCRKSSKDKNIGYEIKPGDQTIEARCQDPKLLLLWKLLTKNLAAKMSFLQIIHQNIQHRLQRSKNIVQKFMMNFSVSQHLTIFNQNLIKNLMNPSLFMEGQTNRKLMHLLMSENSWENFKLIYQRSSHLCTIGIKIQKLNSCMQISTVFNVENSIDTNLTYIIKHIRTKNFAVNLVKNFISKEILVIIDQYPNGKITKTSIMVHKALIQQLTKTMIQ